MYGPRLQQCMYVVICLNKTIFKVLLKIKASKFYIESKKGYQRPLKAYCKGSSVKNTI